MSDISQIQVNGTTYDLCDATSRTQIANLQDSVSFSNLTSINFNQDTAQRYLGLGGIGQNGSYCVFFDPKGINVYDFATNRTIHNTQGESQKNISSIWFECPQLEAQQSTRKVIDYTNLGYTAEPNAGVQTYSSGGIVASVESVTASSAELYLYNAANFTANCQGWLKLTPYVTDL